jgi:hypothetical protein
MSDSPEPPAGEFPMGELPTGGEPVGGEPVGGEPAGGEAAGGEPPRRVRVVLADPRRVHSGPTRRELEEHTGVGDVLVGGLIRAQLGLALRLGLLVSGLFAALPLLFSLAPAIGRRRLFGIELPWLLLGVLPYPILVAIALLYVRQAERNEQEFADMVDDSDPAAAPAANPAADPAADLAADLAGDPGREPVRDGVGEQK